MATYVIVSTVAGVPFGVLDAVLNGNPLARRLQADYQPIARRTIHIPAGVAIDLLYGFVLAALFLLLFDSLPGGSGVLKGVSFAGIAWFLRVVMSVAGQWMTLTVSRRAHVYALVAGLLELLVLGVLYGLTLEP